MNTSLVVNLSKHNVYYINGTRLGFYIAIPNGSFNNTNISIELYPEYDKLDPNNNDSVWIKDEVTRIYKEIDNNNITLVMPIFHDTGLKQTDSVMDQNLYLELDSCISSVINSSYQILSKGNIKVENKIYLVNNGTFNNFCRWFLNRYSTRIEYRTYMELANNGDNARVIPTPVQQPFSNPVDNSNVNIQSQSTVPVSEQAYTQANSNYAQNNNVNPGMQFVGNNMPIIEPPTTGYMNNTPDNESVEVPQAGSAGFVSYLLLGIITVIICLSILYIML